MQVTWKDRGEPSRNFKCAANWLVDGAGVLLCIHLSDQLMLPVNSLFQPPCAEDIVDLTSVWALLL